MIQTIISFTKHTLRAAKHLARSPHLPRWVKALLAFGLLPILGPLDEVALLIAISIIVIRHRPLVAEAWRTTQTKGA